jgi:hypothetical protein
VWIGLLFVEFDAFTVCGDHSLLFIVGAAPIMLEQVDSNIFEVSGCGSDDDDCDDDDKVSSLT